MALQDGALLSAFTSVRISQVGRVVHIRLKHKVAMQKESPFTLHSIAGFRLPTGAIQVERIAGFCHLRNSLQNYWIDQIGSIRDPATSCAIADLAAWVAAPCGDAESPQPGQGDLPRQGLHAAGRNTGVALLESRNKSQVARNIDRAIRLALEAGLFNVAESLERVRGSLPGGPASQAN